MWPTRAGIFAGSIASGPGGAAGTGGGSGAFGGASSPLHPARRSAAATTSPAPTVFMVSSRRVRRRRSERLTDHHRATETQRGTENDGVLVETTAKKRAVPSQGLRLLCGSLWL